MFILFYSLLFCLSPFPLFSSDVASSFYNTFFFLIPFFFLPHFPLFLYPCILYLKKAQEIGFSLFMNTFLFYFTVQKFHCSPNDRKLLCAFCRCHSCISHKSYLFYCPLFRDRPGIVFVSFNLCPLDVGWMRL